MNRDKDKLPTFYSQHGEDYILWQVFKDQPVGYFLEIGALDGVRFSNTFMLEENGWTGICIEAHPDYIETLKSNRPKSICVHAAVGNETGTITFYANKRGSLSTLNAELKDRFAKDYADYFYGYDEVVVPALRVNDILKQFQAPTKIDVVSIDVEGWELQVLQGFDFSSCRPRIFVVEALDDVFENRLIAYMDSHGYFYSRNYFGNIFFCSSKEDSELIKNVDVNCTLVHKAHPLDVNMKDTKTKVIHAQMVKSKKPLNHRAKQMLKKLFHFVFPQKSNKRQYNQALDLGFHGDKYVIDLVQKLLPQVQSFIETGTNVGTTARYIANNYPNLPIYSCEPDKIAYERAASILKDYKWIKLYNQLSPQFLYDLYKEIPDLKHKLNFYWLDAHSYGYEWPLHDEISFITATHTSGILAIDDAKVPDLPGFKYMVDNSQVCDRDYIIKALAKGKTYRIWYPNYTEHTSPHHPLVGVIFVLFGESVQDPNLPHFRREQVTL